MFSKSITNSSRFLMMPSSSQVLYFHFGMNADDDGFCEHFTIMRMTESKPDDLKILQAKGFVKIFDEKVLIITHWKENNYLRSDRYTPSKYLQEYEKELALLVKGMEQPILGIPKVDQRATQVRLGKDRLGKKKEKTSLREFFNKEIKTTSPSKEEFLDYWTEKSPGGKKERWEMERVFDVKRRWNTWLKNNVKFNRGRGETGEVGEIGNLSGKSSEEIRRLVQ